MTAMRGGARSWYAVAQGGRERVADDPATLVPLGLPPGRRPCVATRHRGFKAREVTACEQAGGAWLAAHGVAPDEALASDGQTRRGTPGDRWPGVHLVAAFAQPAGAGLGQGRSCGKGQAWAAVKPGRGQVPRPGRVVTGDARLTQRAGCLHIVAGGGHDLLPVDGNPPTLRAAVEAAFSPLDRAGRGCVGFPAGTALAGGGADLAGGRHDGDDAG
jgi:hypothetical protein